MTVTRCDLADDPRLVASGPDSDSGGVGGVARYDRQHPEPEVEDLFHLGVGDGARGLDLGEDPRSLPGVPAHGRVAVAGEDAGEVPGDATPGDVGEGVHVHVAPQL